MIKIYLAHPGIPSIIRTAKKLQKKLEDEGFQVLNPFDYSPIEQKMKQEWDNCHKIDTAYKIFDMDLSKVNESDIIVAYVPKVFTAGTIMEMYHAFTQGKTIFVYTKIISPWLIVPSGNKVFNNFETLIGEIKKCI
jgi:nucleoside 2-deoxyribosyltransferase